MKGKFTKKLMTFLLTGAFLVTLVPKVAIQNVKADTADFGVGKGIKWPDQVCAPYVDLCDYYEDEGYNINGAPYLPKLSEDTGLKFFNVAFIQATDGQVSDGKVNWGWAGLSVLSEKSTDQWQYSGIKQSIKDIREAGGDVAISLGGRDNVAIWQVSRDENVLYETYKEIVDGYGLTRMDLDIEGGAQGKEENACNAKAIKKLQDNTGVEITLTLPVLPDGLTSVQLDLLQVYLEAGVDVKMVNIMAMCYGSGVFLPGENYGTGSVRAIDSTMKQIQDYYKKYANTNLTEAEAYRKVGVTTSIGYESSSDPIFTVEWSKLVTDHAIEKSIGMTSFWSLNRDSKLQKNEGIYNAYEHTKEYSRFGSVIGSDNFEPQILGVTDKTIKLGSSFDYLVGITATDKEDGDLTKNIVVEGTVDVNKEGEYKLTYSVTDSKGASKTVYRTITVTANEVINNKPVISGVSNKTLVIGEDFDPLKGITATDKEDGDLTKNIVVEGTVNTKVLGKYTLTYSVEDKDGQKTEVSCVVEVVNKEDTVEEYDFLKVYNEGDIVRYNGVKYKCLKWHIYQYPDASPEYWEKINEETTVLDLGTVASLYRSKKGDALYNSNYDLNKDGVIDIVDIVLIAKNL